MKNVTLYRLPSNIGERYNIKTSLTGTKIMNGF